MINEFLKNKFYKVYIKGTSKLLKKENIIGKVFYIYYSNNKAYKFGNPNEVFNFRFNFHKNRFVFYTICLCEEKDTFCTKVPLSSLKQKKFTVKSFITKPHQDIGTSYKLNQHLVLEFNLIENIKTLKKAKDFFKKTKIEDFI